MTRELISFKKAKPPKKYVVVVRIDGKKRTIRFGQAGASDFTKHKDEERKQRYIDRHRKREDWTRSGVMTAGFWSRWVLWNRPTIKASLEDALRKGGLSRA